MELLSKIYIELLNRGFLVLRQAVDANDLEWVRAEMELLHNVPSLIDENNKNRHEYFWSREVVDYQEWVANCGRELPKSRMKIYYEPLWWEIKPLVEEYFTGSLSSVGLGEVISDRNVHNTVTSVSLPAGNVTTFGWSTTRKEFLIATDYSSGNLPRLQKIDGWSRIMGRGCYLSPEVLDSFLKDQEMREQGGLDSAMETRREIQRRFMPNCMPNIPGYEVSTWWLPNQTVGGDYCDVLSLGAGKLGLCVADVSGHGLGPSLLMASVRAALHALVLEHSSPQVLMEMLGQALTNDLNATGFITMVLASLDYQTHQVVFSNAGHAPALHYSVRTNTFSPMEATGMPLGVVDHPQLPLGPPIEMQPGDWMVLCTDGIVDAMDPGGVLFGYERLEKIVEKNSHATAHDLVHIIGSQVEQHYIEEHPQDDLTILALKRLQ